MGYTEATAVDLVSESDAGSDASSVNSPPRARREKGTNVAGKRPAAIASGASAGKARALTLRFSTQHI